jgi:hypothetical protein
MSAARKITITPFSRVSDVTISKPMPLTWEKLTERLSKIELKPRKEDVPGWAPTLFRPTCDCGEEDCPGERGHRIGLNALEVYALVLDIDKRSDGTPLDEISAKNALRALESMGLRHVVHTTFNHQPPAHVSLRAVIALSRPVPAAQWEEFWTLATKHIGIHVEVGCKNADRFWYLPSAPVGEEADSWSKALDGKPLDVDAIVAIGKANAKAAAAAPASATTLETLAGMKAWMYARYPDARHYQKRGRDCWEIECPWEDEHSSKAKRDTVVSYAEGTGDDKGPGFSCLHDHCKDIRRWTEFRSKVQPGWKPGAYQPEQTDHDWQQPKPVGDHLAPVLPFKPDLLPVDLHDWVLDIADRMQVPIDLVAINAMSALSVVATGARTIHPKQFDPWRVYPILWGAGIAPPSSMKTPAMKAAIKPLETLESRARETFKAQQAQRDVLLMVRKAQRDGIKKQIEKAVAAGEVVDAASLAGDLPDDDSALQRPRRFLTQDSTVEKIQDLVDRGAKSRSYPLAIARDELLGWFHTLEKDGREDDRYFFLEGWGVANRGVDRIGRGEIFTKDLSLIVFGNTTPGPFQTYVREACRGGDGADGLLQRFQLMVYPDPLANWKLVDRSENRMAARRATDVYERLAGIFEADKDGKPPALRFTDEAQIVFNVWLTDLTGRLNDREAHAALVSHFGKYRSLMPAIALMLHLASGPGTENEPVSAWAARTAIEWCTYLGSHAIRVYGIAANPYRVVANAIADRITAGKFAGTVTRRHIQHALDAYEAKDVADAVELLEELGWLRTREVRKGKGSRGGAPSVEVDINPRAVKQ